MHRKRDAGSNSRKNSARVSWALSRLAKYAAAATNMTIIAAAIGHVRENRSRRPVSMLRPERRGLVCVIERTHLVQPEPTPIRIERSWRGQALSVHRM